MLTEMLNLKFQVYKSSVIILLRVLLKHPNLPSKDVVILALKRWAAFYLR